MSPNPLDVQTIHASQNDNEARQWEFELHNNGELIDTSDVKEQLVFKAYKGGTEQLLPENGSTPTTSPFKGDIKYPQGLLTDQEFTYRQSPTEEDGLAKITDIKGNTLVWNQLIEKGNMTDGWTFSNSTGSYANNILTFTASAQGGFVRPNNPQSIVANHKYLAMVDVKGASAFTSTINFTSRNLITANITTNWQTFSLVFTNTITEGNFFPRVYDYRRSDWDAIQIRNCMLFDLTQMGLDITDPSDFTSLFSLPYYDYNAGSLLSFNGNGIKTVGKNQCNVDDVQVGKAWNNASNSARAVLFAPIRPNTQYTISITSLGTVEGIFVVEESEIGILNGISATLNNATKSFTFTSKSDSKYIALQCNKTAITKSDFESVKFMVEHGASASLYEPYTSSTLSLPISTYFHNGMDGVGTDYDELTNTKATKRMARVDLGSLNWRRLAINEGYAFVSDEISDMKQVGNVTTANVLCPSYTLYMSGNGYSIPNDKSYRVGGSYFGTRRVTIRDDSYTDATAFKTAMSGVYLVYPLATPTETSITTEDANEALSLLMGKSVSSDNANQLINIITKGE